MDKDKVVGYIKQSITYNAIESVIVGAFEGGSNYWLGLDNRGEEWKGKPKDEPLSIWATKLLVEGKTLHFYDIEDEEERWELTLDRMIEGFRLNAERRPFDSNIEEGDAETADCILQYALFGRLVYG